MKTRVLQNKDLLSVECWVDGGWITYRTLKGLNHKDTMISCAEDLANKTVTQVFPDPIVIWESPKVKK